LAEGGVLMLSHRTIGLLLLGLGLVLAPLADAQVLSTFRDNVLVPMANNQPFPQGLFDTALPTPFISTTVGGGTTLATTYLQTIEVRSQDPVNIGLPMFFATHIVREDQSVGIYTEPSEGVVDIMDPILRARLAIGTPTGANALPAIWQLNLLDADGNGGNGPTPFINDFLTEAPLGEPIAVFQSPGPIPVALVSPLGEIIATNTMTGFQFTSVNPVTLDPLNNMFGIYLDDWTMLEMDVDGAPSPFLMGWMNMPQIRWKPHMRGGPPVAVVVGMGPAALWHGPIPEPALGGLLMAIAGYVWTSFRRAKDPMN
ncbi:MAG TPA: hypothetical protein VIY86_12655, partial [Pirellulaceae bacterium]